MSKSNAINPKRDEDFSEWFQQVINEAELAEHSPVRGCMVIKPYGYAIWENIQKIFDIKLKKIGVQNAYFPLLIPLEFLSKEADHIDGFAKECAIVTHHRLKKNDSGELVPDGELQFPYVIRPTSEAIIGNVISKWIRSYRDLPLKLNQWCNVLRWEMRPRLFLRTSEFLWQEGHTVFSNEKDAIEDAKQMHEIYFNFIKDELSMYSIIGEKPEEERFPGAQNTYTIEIMAQDGKAMQAATSHYLAQSFSKAFDIKFTDKNGKEEYGYTTSWGITTRLIGAIIMVHGDDDGLILPPEIAPHQVVIIPIIHNESNKEKIEIYCNNVKKNLEEINIRAFIDNSENTSSSKVWKWIKKGAPIRLEIGIKEVNESKITLARRDHNHKEKTTLNINEIDNIAQDILKDIAKSIYKKSKENFEKNILKVNNIKEIDDLFNKSFNGFVKIQKNKTDTGNNNNNESNFKSICEKHSLSRRCLIEEDGEKFVIVSRAY